MNKTIDEYLKENWKTPITYNCEDCGVEVTRTGTSFHHKPHLKCKACYMKSVYGVTSNIQRPEAQKKKEDTFMQKYNSKSSFSSKEVRQKSKETLIKNYGVDNYFKRSDLVEESHKKAFNAKAPAQNPEILEKIIETNKRNHDSMHNFSNPETRSQIEGILEQKYGSKHFGTTTEYHKKARLGYFYKNEFFDSSWELAYWIYCKDNNIDLKRNTTPHKMSNGHSVYFDFISNGRYIEVKGDYLKREPDWEFKLEAYSKYDVKVMFEKDMKPILKYIYNRYGKNYLKKFQNKKPGDFKRKIIEYDEIDEETFIRYKHKNIRFHYVCNHCGKDVYPVWKTIDKHHDHLCKTCRNVQLKQNATNYNVEEVENKTSTESQKTLND